MVTNSVVVAHTLAARNDNRVFMAGGELRGHDGGAFGHGAIDFVRGFTVRYAVLSVGAINADSGFMLHNMQEAEFSRAVMGQAQTRMVAADSAKFGRWAPIVVADASSFDMLVADEAPPEAIAAMLKRADIELVLAGDTRGS